MRIDGLSVYTKYNGLSKNKINDNFNNFSINVINKSNSLAQDNDLAQLKNIDTKNIITPIERKYFQNMFPESSELIEKHELFTRNAKIQNPDLRKGYLVDGKI